jgi:hypothetical protein
VGLFYWGTLRAEWVIDSRFKAQGSRLKVDNRNSGTNSFLNFESTFLETKSPARHTPAGLSVF